MHFCLQLSFLLNNLLSIMVCIDLFSAVCGVFVLHLSMIYVWVWVCCASLRYPFVGLPVLYIQDVSWIKIHAANPTFVGLTGGKANSSYLKIWFTWGFFINFFSLHVFHAYYQQQFKWSVLCIMQLGTTYTVHAHTYTCSIYTHTHTQTHGMDTCTHRTWHMFQNTSYYYLSIII